MAGINHLIVKPDSEQVTLETLSLKIISVNVNSIVSHSKRYELISFLETNNPDIALLCETKLNMRHKIQLQNYEIIRTDRPNSLKGGGTAILIKRDLKVHWCQIFDPSSMSNNILEYSIVKIKLNQTKNLFLVSVYANNECGNVFVDELNNLFKKLKLNDLNNYYIIAGDFNARQVSWGDVNSNYKGHLLAEWISQKAHEHKACLYLPSAATFPSAGSFLDLSIIDSRIDLINLVNNKLNILQSFSDHEALYLIINLNCNDSIIFRSKDEPGSLLFKKTKWKKFTKDLSSNCTSIIPNNTNLSRDEIDTHLNSLNLSIQNSIKKYVPKYDPSSNTLNYVNKKIKKLHETKSKMITLLKSYKRNGCSSNDTIIILLKNNIKIIAEKLKSEFKSSYTKYWESQYKKIDYRKSDWFFPRINALFRKRPLLDINELHIPVNNSNLINRTNIDPSTLTQKDGNYIITNPADKINIIGAHYEQINSPRHTNIGSKTKSIVDDQMFIFKQDFLNFRSNNEGVVKFSNDNPAHDPKSKKVDDKSYFCNPLQIQLILKQLPNKTSSSVDGIPPIILKNLPFNVIKNYTILFNNCLNLCYFPSAWKKAKVLPILKKGKNPYDPVSYRPISLTPSISKVFEAVINNLVNHHTIENNIIPDNQFGFRFKHSTTHAINKFTSDINMHLHKNEIVGACLIDIEKAFDSVWNEGLIYVLIREKYPKYLIYVIWDTITNKTFVTWDGKNISTLLFKILEGLSQGTVNSPTLFNIYNNKILNIAGLNKNNNTYSIAFADDLVIYVADQDPAVVNEKLQSLVTSVNNYYLNWNLKSNPQKCEIIIFHKPLRFLAPSKRVKIKNFQINLVLNNKTHKIEVKKSVRYLGVQLDYLIRMNNHIEIQLKKASDSFKKYCRLFMCKYLEARAKIICYLLLIRPIITYGAPIWWNMSASMAEKLRLFERSCIRTCLNAYRSHHSDGKHMISNFELYNMAQIPRIDCFILKLTRDYYQQISNINNKIIRKFLDLNTHDCYFRAESGYITPQMFTYFDKQGVIQDSYNKPILYHISRHKSNKSLPRSYENPIKTVYSTTIPIIDTHNYSRINNKYWWLDKDALHLDELRRRKRLKY